MLSPLSLITVAAQFLFTILIIVTGPIILTHKFLLGVQLMAIFTGLWAIWTIRFGNFNIAPEVAKNARLVISGPYRYIRHPMYTTLLVFTLPMVLGHPTYLRILYWVALLVTLIVKLNYEEKLLSRHFPEYSQYQQQTKRLIPFVF